MSKEDKKRRKGDKPSKKKGKGDKASKAGRARAKEEAEAADPALRSFGAVSEPVVATATVAATPADLGATLAAILQSTQADIVVKALSSASLDEKSAQSVAAALQRGLAAGAGSKSAAQNQGTRTHADDDKDGGGSSSTVKQKQTQKDARGEDTDRDDTESEGSDSDSETGSEDERKDERDERKRHKHERGRKHRKSSRSAKSSGHKHSRVSGGLAELRDAMGKLSDKGSDGDGSDTEGSDGSRSSQSDRDEHRGRVSEGPSFASILAKHKVTLPRYLRGLDRKRWHAPGQVEKVASFGQSWLQFAASRDWEKDRNRRECHTIAMVIEALLARNIPLALEILTRRFEGVREADETGDWVFANLIGLTSDLTSSLPAEQLEAYRKKVRENRKQEAADSAARKTSGGGKKKKGKKAWAEGQATAAGQVAAQQTTAAQQPTKHQAAGGATRQQGGRPAA